MKILPRISGGIMLSKVRSPLVWSIVVASVKSQKQNDNSPRPNLGLGAGCRVERSYISFGNIRVTHLFALEGRVPFFFTTTTSPPFRPSPSPYIFSVFVYVSPFLLPIPNVLSDL